MSFRNLNSICIQDAAVQAEMQPWVDIECYQLGSGAVVGQLESLDLGTQQIVRETQQVEVHKLGNIPSGLCTISCCRLDHATAADRFNDISASGRLDSLYFLPGDVGFDIHVPAGARTEYILFDQAEFLRGARALDPQGWDRAPEQLASMPGTRQDTLTAAVDQWLELAEGFAASETAVAQDLLQRQLMQHMLGIATAGRHHDSMPPTAGDRARAFHVCRRARTYVDECLDRNTLPTLMDLCTELGVSVRTLQYAFRAYIGMPPLTYLRLCRLNRARTLLRASEPACENVTRIALQLGFLHLGRFAGDYRRMFGEAPSTTLAH